MYLFLIFSVSLFLSISNAKMYAFKKEAGTTIFKATALGLKFDGKGTGPSGTIQVEDKVSGEVMMDLDSLDTGIGLRNTHMKDNYLETKKFPMAKLIIDEVKDFNINSPPGNYMFSGRLVVRNIEKTIENGQLKIKKIDSGFEIESQFDTKISDFSIPIPKYAGLALKDAVQVHVKTTAMESMK
jgi:hypothetical protein